MNILLQVFFWGWILWAIFESILISVVPLYTLRNSEPSNGQLNTFWECGATTFTISIIIINAKILFLQSRQHYFHYFVLSMSIMLWFSSAFLINSVLWFDPDWYMMWNHLVVNPAFWLTILMLSVGILSKDLYLAGLERSFNFKPYHILQEMEAAASSGKVAGIVDGDGNGNGVGNGDGNGDGVNAKASASASANANAKADASSYDTGANSTRKAATTANS